MSKGSGGGAARGDMTVAGASPLVTLYGFGSGCTERRAKHQSRDSNCRVAMTWVHARHGTGAQQCS